MDSFFENVKGKVLGEWENGSVAGHDESFGLCARMIFAILHKVYFKNGGQI